MKKIFVTGASGFVGGHLIPMLVEKYEVIALVKTKKDTKFVDKRAKIIIGDLAIKGKWQVYLKDQDVLVHMAAQISSKTPRKFKRNNVLATKNLINAAKRHKVKKIILFSSAAVTSIRKDWYANTKQEKEKIVTNSKINYAIIRPSMIYGPGDTKNIGWLIKVINKFPIIPLPGGGKFGRQPLFVVDICKIVIKLIEGKSKNKIYDIHGKEYITMERMVRCIITQSGSRKFPVVVPIILLSFWAKVSEKILPNPKFTLDQIKSLTSGEKFSGDKWWETFDIIPTRFEDGIKAMLKYN